MFHYRSVHFPIALLLLGAFLEVVAWWMKEERKHTLHTVSLMLLMFGWAGTLASVGTGLWMESEFNHPRLDLHKTLGIACLVLASLTIICHAVRRRWPWMVGLRTGFYLATAILVALTGHHGGMMAHGEQKEQDKPGQRRETPSLEGKEEVLRIAPRRLPPRRSPSAPTTPRTVQKNRP